MNPLVALAGLQAQVPSWLVPLLEQLWAAVPQKQKDELVAAVLREARAAGDAVLHGASRTAVHVAVWYARRRLLEGASPDVFPDLVAFPEWSIPNDVPNQEGPPPRDG